MPSTRTIIRPRGEVNVAHWIANAPTPPYGQALGSVEDASSCIIIAESDGGESRGNDVNNAPWVPNDAAGTRHNGGANYGFVDGHAKMLTPNTIDPAGSDWKTSMELE